MKKILLLLSLIVIAEIFSCKKEAVTQSKSIVSLNVINANIGVSSTQVNYWGTPVDWANYTNSNVNYGSNVVFTINSGRTKLLIVSVADTLHPLFNGSITTTANTIYSLFLSGQSPATDTLLIKENFPSHTSTDSTCSVRFINLSPNSNPLKVSLSNSVQTEFDNISYKRPTFFKNYPSKKINTNYVFEVTDAVTNNLLTTYALTTPYLNNVTLVIKGLEGTTSGSNAFGVFRVNNY